MKHEYNKKQIPATAGRPSFTTPELKSVRGPVHSE